ncbi:MAG: hypothetical protein KAJ39_09425 [Gammaproteobacteria bacterium]|nr:hypothetical protein [Gammaproteobacteria bacterium]
MKDTSIYFRCEESYKKEFKEHCGLVDMSVKIRELIDNDIKRAAFEKEELEEFHRQFNYPK